MMKARILLLLLCLAPFGAMADITISSAWVAEAPPVSRVHAGYMIISNDGERDLDLVAARSEGYRKVEIHQSIESGGVASMRKLDSVTIKAGERVVFEPGGYHLMLMGPIERWKAGDSFPVTLKFDDGSERSITTRVKKHHGDGGGHDHDHHQHEHHQHDHQMSH